MKFNKLAEGALGPIIQATIKEEEDWSQYCCLGYTADDQPLSQFHAADQHPLLKNQYQQLKSLPHRAQLICKVSLSPSLLLSPNS